MSLTWNLHPCPLPIGLRALFKLRPGLSILAVVEMCLSVVLSLEYLCAQPWASLIWSLTCGPSCWSLGTFCLWWPSPDLVLTRTPALTAHLHITIILPGGLDSWWLPSLGCPALLCRYCEAGPWLVRYLSCWLCYSACSLFPSGTIGLCFMTS